MDEPWSKSQLFHLIAKFLSVYVHALGICLLLSTKLISVLICSGLRPKISRTFWKQLKNISKPKHHSLHPPSFRRKAICQGRVSLCSFSTHSFLELSISTTWKREWGRMGLQGLQLSCRAQPSNWKCSLLGGGEVKPAPLAGCSP